MPQPAISARAQVTKNCARRATALGQSLFQPRWLPPRFFFFSPFAAFSSVALRDVLALLARAVLGLDSDFFLDAFLGGEAAVVAAAPASAGCSVAASAGCPLATFSASEGCSDVEGTPSTFFGRPRRLGSTARVASAWATGVGGGAVSAAAVVAGCNSPCSQASNRSSACGSRALNTFATTGA